MRADGAALNAINVLANDSDPDGDALTVTIEQAPDIGTASVNSNNTVKLEPPSSGFKGVTSFKYRVADSTGASAVATAAIFVGVDPFRVAFAADPTGTGAAEVHLADFFEPARALTTATEGNLRLRGFAAANNGSTVVYRREDTTAPATTDLSFVRTAAAAQQVRITFPNGMKPVPDANGRDQFAVSPDGRWIAAVTGDGSSRAVYVLNVDTPADVVLASPAGAVHAAMPRFSLNSQALYFLASDVAGGARQSLYTVALSDPATPAQISATNAPGGADTVLDYFVATDQSRILLEANRSGRVGLYFVDPSHLQTETRISHALAAGETIIASTIGLDPGSGGNARGERVAYTTQRLLTFRSYVAEGSATPNPRDIGPVGSIVIGFRPDGDALLYSRNGTLYETAIGGATAELQVGDGDTGWYDSTGNIVLLEQSLPSGGSPTRYPALAVTVRGSFGTAQTLGTSGMAAHFIDTSGFDRAVTIIGEGATTGAAPARAHLALVNALAPGELLYLADFDSPLELTSPGARVVGY